MFYRRIAVVLVPVLVLGFGSAAFSQNTGKGRARIRMGGVRAPAVARDGWWMRLEKQPALPSKLVVVAAGKAKADDVTMTWEASNPFEWDVPAVIRDAQVLHLALTATPLEQPVAVCVFFKTEGIARIEFKGSAKSELSQKKSAKGCTV